MGHGKYSIGNWRAVRKGLDAGGTIRGVAEATGVDRNAVFRWSGADKPPERMWLMLDIDAAPARKGAREKGAPLDYEDRVMIFLMLGDGKKTQEIADAVGCHRTTVARELRRMPEGRYDPRLAQRDAERKARRPKERKLDAPPRLRAYVVNALMLKWSPEQISMRLREDFPGDEEMRVSHETIYRALYVQGRLSKTALSTSTTRSRNTVPVSKDGPCTTRFCGTVARPMARFLNVPPKPAMPCPLKCATETQLS